MLTGRTAYRAALALLMVFLLGSASTIPLWRMASLIGRPMALILLVVVAVYSTRRIDPSYTTSGRIVFGLLHWLVLSAVLVTFWSIDPVESIVTVVAIAALLLIVQRSSTRRWQDRSVLTGDFKTIVWIISIVLFVGLVAHAAGLLPPAHGGRFQGLLNNPNIAAQIGALTLAIGWGVYREQRSWLNLLVLSPSALTLLLSETRTTFIAIGVAIIWLLLKKGVQGFLSGIALAVAVTFVVSTFGMGPLAGFFQRFGQETDNDSLSGRTLLWSSGFELIGARPYGTGWGSTAAVAEQLGGFENYHNSFMQTAIEGGILALLLLLTVYLVFVILLLRLPITGLGSGISAAILVGILVQFTESGVFGVGQPFPYLFWMSVGAALSLNCKQSDTTDRAESLQALRI